MTSLHVQALIQPLAWVLPCAAGTTPLPPKKTKPNQNQTPPVGNTFPASRLAQALAFHTVHKKC